GARGRLEGVAKELLRYERHGGAGEGLAIERDLEGDCHQADPAALVKGDPLGDLGSAEPAVLVLIQLLQAPGQGGTGFQLLGVEETVLVTVVLGERLRGRLLRRDGRDGDAPA